MIEGFVYTDKDLDLLRDDVNYYGMVGKKYLSNSDIGTLLTNPKEYKKPTETTKALLEGRYFHELMLEPEKAKDVITVDVSSRNTKAYKEFLEEHKADMVLLEKEAGEIRRLTSIMKSNMVMFDAIYEEGNLYEEPAIIEIGGVMWKGKADIVCKDKLIDIKTTSNIYDFKYSARKYNYDSQAWIYEQLFGKPLIFYVIDKTNDMLGIFEPNEQFLDRGKEKVFQAIEVYNKFFGANATEDIEQYIIFEELV